MLFFKITMQFVIYKNLLVLKTLQEKDPKVHE